MNSTRDPLRRERFDQAAKSPVASRDQIRSLLAPFLSPGDTYVVQRIRFQSYPHILRDDEIPVRHG